MEINTTNQTVTRGGEQVTLTGREYALVEYLALHRGRLVTRTMIYDHLFNEDDDTLSNLVEVHVFNIRKKLGKDFILKLKDGQTCSMLAIRNTKLMKNGTKQF